jgi:hypothetical protein
MKEPRKRKRETKREFIREPTDDGNGSEKKKMERIKLTGDERETRVRTEGEHSPHAP